MLGASGNVPTGDNAFMSGASNRAGLNAAAIGYSNTAVTDSVAVGIKAKTRQAGAFAIGGGDPEGFGVGNEQTNILQLTANVLTGATTTLKSALGTTPGIVLQNQAHYTLLVICGAGENNNTPTKYFSTVVLVDVTRSAAGVTTVRGSTKVAEVDPLNTGCTVDVVTSGSDLNVQFFNNTANSMIATATVFVIESVV
jgi:hypothetical protein